MNNRSVSRSVIFAIVTAIAVLLAALVWAGQQSPGLGGDPAEIDGFAAAQNKVPCGPYGQVKKCNDADNDGIPDQKDKDDDNDGVKDAKDRDDDGDGIKDGKDKDDDNDGVPDKCEKKKGKKKQKCINKNT